MWGSQQLSNITKKGNIEAKDGERPPMGETAHPNSVTPLTLLPICMTRRDGGD